MNLYDVKSYEHREEVPMFEKWRRPLKRLLKWLKQPTEMRMSLKGDKAIEEVLYARHALGFESNEEYFRVLLVSVSSVVREMEERGGTLCVRYPDGSFKAVPITKALWDRWGLRDT